jgi:hypothetical protein
MTLDELQALADRLTAYQQRQPVGFTFGFYTEQSGSLRLYRSNLAASRLGWLTGDDMPDEGFRHGGGSVNFTNAYFETQSPRLAAALTLEPPETGLQPGQWLAAATPPEPAPKPIADVPKTGKRG